MTNESSLITPLVPRTDFPALSREIDDKPISYLDSAATSLKCRPVIDAVHNFYEHSCANIHRGSHTLSREVSQAYESARDSVARFINAVSREVTFTSNTTEGINLVAESLALAGEDNVVSSVLDHHSNLLPWMRRCTVRFLPEGSDGTVDIGRLEDLIDARTKLVALSHVSNVTGAINRAREAIEIAHRRGVPVLIDGAQSVPHLPVDVQQLDCDFLAFSSHKMLGPSGVGALYINERVWDRMNNLKIGGGTVDHVRRDGFVLKRIPQRFEAGTPNIEGAIGFGAAVEYLASIGMDRVAEHDTRLSRTMLELMSRIRGITVLGPTDPAKKIAILSFAPLTRAIDVETFGMMLSDSHKIMARAGTHCAHPYFEEKKLQGAVRFSTYIYTSEEEIRRAVNATEEILSNLGGR